MIWLPNLLEKKNLDFENDFIIKNFYFKHEIYIWSEFLRYIVAYFLFYLKISLNSSSKM